MPTQAWILTLTLLGAGSAWAEPESGPPPGYLPPEAQGLCPALEEDYELCSDDLWSGNCADLVSDASRLGEVYRSEVREHPGWVAALQTGIWWGCGSANLAELRSALERIDTPQARAVLAQEPYRSLPQPTAPAAPPPPPPSRELDCVAPSTPEERAACAARNLAVAKAEHERLFGACRERVDPALRQQLIDAETSWQKFVGLECSGPGYTRDECLAQAYAERSRSIVSMHPECAAPGTDGRG